MALTQTVLFYGATFWGIAHAGAGLSAVLANTDPLFVAVLATLLLGERLGSLQWFGLAVGLLGAACVVWEGPAVAARGLERGARGRGRRPGLERRHGGGLAQHARPALTRWRWPDGRWRSAGIVLAVRGWPRARGGADGRAGARPGLILGLGVVGSAAPLALFYLALMRAPASEVSAWFFLIPVIGVLSAWPLLGEDADPRLVIGLGGVSLGLWLVLGGRGPGTGAGW